MRGFLFHSALAMFFFIINLCKPLEKKVMKASSDQNSFTPFVDSEEEEEKISSSFIDSALDIVSARISLKEDLIYGRVPLLSFQRSSNSNFVRILRCRRDTHVGSKDLLEYAKIGSSFEKTNLFLEDVFRRASEKSSCSYLPMSKGGDEGIIDYWSKSGSWLYLISPCVHPSRIVLDTSTSRNCSKKFVVAFDADRELYENQMKEKAKTYLEFSKKFTQKVYDGSKNLAYKSELAVSALRDCDDREFKRQVKSAHKKAMLVVVAAAADFVLEYKSWDKKLIKEKGGGFKGHVKALGIMDMFQLFQAPAGDTFGEALNDLFKTSDDMPRSCTTYMKLAADMQVKTCEILTWAMFDKMWEIMAENYMLSDKSVEDPNASTFKDLPFPEKAEEAVECSSPKFGGR